MLVDLIIENFDLSRLNMIFLATGFIITTASLISSQDYSYPHRNWFYLSLVVYTLSFSMIILTTNWIIFMIGWELVTITTFAMLLWGGNKIARIYLIIQFIGSNFLLYVVLLIMNAGYTTIGPIDNFNLQLLLILGVGLKSAIIGLHFWLPIVHSRAPSPVSTILSGWVVKLGFILLLKTVVTGNIVLFYAGIAMVIYAGIEAIYETDYKVLLAYSTISQLGFIAIGLGSGNTYAYWGSVLHIIVHGLAKTSLFLGSGYWIKKIKRRTIYDFKNGWYKDKINSVLTIFGLLVLVGFPLIAGYNSKTLIKYAAGDSTIFKYLFHFLSILTYLYVIRFLGWGIFKVDKTEEIREENVFIEGKTIFSMALPLFVILVLAFVSNSIIEIDYNNFHFMNGFIKSIIYIVISLGILKAKDWIYVKEKPVPSMDRLLIRIKNWYHIIMGEKTVQTLEVDMENQIYNILISIADFIHGLLPKKIQSQLLLIPIAVLLLLLFI